MEQQGVNPIQYIRDKYGDNGNIIRLYADYYFSGIPEKFWTTDKDKITLSETGMKVSKGLKSSAVSAFYDSTDIEIRDFAEISKKLIQSNNSVKFLNFHWFISRMSNKYGNNVFDEVVNTLEQYKYIFFSNIRGGKLFYKYEEEFTVLIENLMYSVIDKKVILGFDKVDEPEDVYGSLHLMLNNTQDSIIIE